MAAGKRINLSELADDPPLQGARVPTFAEISQPRPARVDQVAANPLNTRDVYSQPEKLVSLVESIRLHGQLQPCTVVTREAFLATFPEHAPSVGDSVYVQVTGARRRAAALELGLSSIDISLKNSLAESRTGFISATAAENIDREDYDPVEEARAVQLLVQECGSGKQAAEQLSRTPGWVSHRLNLLKLEPELRSAIQLGEMPLREVRDLHKRSRDEQLAALKAWQTVMESRGQSDDARRQRYAADGDTSAQEQGADGVESSKKRQPRRSPIAAAIYRLGGTPTKIAETLRAELSVEDRRSLAEALLYEE